MNVTTEIALAGAAIVGLGAYMLTSGGEEKAVDPVIKIEGEEKAVEPVIKIEPGMEGPGGSPERSPSPYVRLHELSEGQRITIAALMAVMEAKPRYASMPAAYAGNDERWEGSDYLKSIIGIPLTKMFQLYPDTQTITEDGYYGGTYLVKTRGMRYRQKKWGDFRPVTHAAHETDVSWETDMGEGHLYALSRYSFGKFSAAERQTEWVLRLLVTYLRGISIAFKRLYEENMQGLASSLGSIEAQNQELAEIYYLMSHMLYIESLKVEMAKTWHEVEKNTFNKTLEFKIQQKQRPAAKDMPESYSMRGYTDPTRGRVQTMIQELFDKLSAEKNKPLAETYVKVVKRLEERRALVDDTPAEVRRRMFEPFDNPRDPMLPVFAPPTRVEPFNPPAPRL